MRVCNGWSWRGTRCRRCLDGRTGDTECKCAITRHHCIGETPLTTQLTRCRDITVDAWVHRRGPRCRRCLGGGGQDGACGRKPLPDWMSEVSGSSCGTITSVRIPLPHFFAWMLEPEPWVSLWSNHFGEEFTSPLAWASDIWVSLWVNRIVAEPTSPFCPSR